MSDAIEILEHVDPTQLDYEQWLQAGMALKDAGASVDVWDSWSMNDAVRYRPGLCQRKWESFRGNGTPVTVASLVKFAKDQGWQPPAREGWGHVGEGAEIAWDAEIGAQDRAGGLRVVDERWVKEVDLPPVSVDWDPVAELTTYLTTIYESHEYVAYVTASYLSKDAGRYLPTKGDCSRTCGQLIEALQTCGGDIGAVFGDYTPAVGAWIRPNPMDGKGVADANVTAWRHALVESDALSVDRQYALMRELELPIAAMVHSGGKSIHAIVRVDADSYEDYRKQVDFLYEVCKRNGLELDRGNRNPSRLSRMPGIMRGDKPQYLIGTNLGKASWAEWREWIEDLNDDLPDIAELRITGDEPVRAPELIQGVLRMGHKMILSGPSKAGKSFLLGQLAIALAEGARWLGWQVRQGRVLYVNLELDPVSSDHRYWTMYQVLGIQQTPGMLDVWNLRGHATSMDRLAPKLIRRAQQKRYTAVIIDPIYKVITGDENSAEAMALFCNLFDRIAQQLGAAVIYAHHHSKGVQGHKSAADRSSGSGVFSRDPDAIVDLIELQVDDDRRKQLVSNWECVAMATAFDVAMPAWREACPQDDALVADHLATWGEANGLGDQVRQARPEARDAAMRATGWRVEGTLREFAAFPARRCWFRYPLHLPDDVLLADAKAAGEEPPWAEAQRAKVKAVAERRDDAREALDVAFEAVRGFAEDQTAPVALRDLAEHMAVTIKTVRRRVEKHPSYVVEDGSVRLVGEMATTTGEF